jgi:hypothetical protein
MRHTLTLVQWIPIPIHTMGNQCTTTPLRPAGAEHHFFPRPSSRQLHRDRSLCLRQGQGQATPVLLPCCGLREGIGEQPGVVQGRGAVTCLLRFIYLFILFYSILFYWGTNQVQYSSRREPDVPSIHLGSEIRCHRLFNCPLVRHRSTVHPRMRDCVVSPSSSSASFLLASCC